MTYIRLLIFGTDLPPATDSLKLPPTLEWSVIPVIKPELTVATVIERDGRFLLVEEYVGGRAVLNQPAGHVEPGETILQAAVRETREETAWSVTPQALLGVYYWPQTERGNCVLRCTFCAHANSQDAQQSLDDGIITTHWLSREQLQARNERLRSPLVLAAIDAWVAGVRLPLSSIHCIGHEPL